MLQNEMKILRNRGNKSAMQGSRMLALLRLRAQKSAFLESLSMFELYENCLKESTNFSGSHTG